MILFRMGREATPVHITDKVIDHLNQHRQVEVAQSEAGGGVFVTEHAHGLTIATITGPYPGDARGRCHYKVDKSRLNDDIRRLRRTHQFFIGIWHTHPEDEPQPSKLDLQAMRELFCNNEHALSAMLMLIVGRLPVEDSLWVSLHTATTFEHVMLNT
jgi:integrative and conjugative element protein (TIGR02256 family)